ncbi:MAG TPA: Sec-independent protein translocase protein TatB [Steroidobacteraceae bacterium]|nr:Sec-independent protein translocase protein TatB [Steroidobacteraceae bacterium]
MLDFGFSEILLTSAIALVVLGPERLPKVARQVGNWMGRARAMARQLSEQLEREVSAEELLKETRDANPPGANRIAPPYAPLEATSSAPYVPPLPSEVPPPAAGVAPHVGHDACADPPAPAHAEYNPATKTPTSPPSND